MSRIEVLTLKALSIMALLILTLGIIEETATEQAVAGAPALDKTEMVVADVLPVIKQVESHGDCTLVSNKGAKGCYQIEDETAAHPGYGIRPLRNHTPKEEERFAHDYFKKLLQQYHNADIMLAEAAYNCGKGCVDKALAKLPAETRRYIYKINSQLAMEEGE